jgi:hypothetical protein
MDSEQANTKPGRWAKGTSGNPSGRPKGSRNKATMMIEQLLEGEAEDLARKAVELAKKGDIQALRLCLERLIPARKERCVQLDLPPAATLQDVAIAFQDVFAAVAEGRIAPGEGLSLATILKNQVQIIEARDLARRLELLESKLAEKPAESDPWSE